MLLEDVNSWFERLLKMAKGVNSWLQDLDTRQEDGKMRWLKCDSIKCCYMLLNSNKSLKCKILTLKRCSKM